MKYIILYNYICIYIYSVCVYVCPKFFKEKYMYTYIFIYYTLEAYRYFLFDSNVLKSKNDVIYCSLFLENFIELYLKLLFCILHFLYLYLYINIYILYYIYLYIVCLYMYIHSVYIYFVCIYLVFIYIYLCVYIKYIYIYIFLYLWNFHYFDVRPLR